MTKFELSASISSHSPKAIQPVLERIIANKGTIKPTNEGFEVRALLEGDSAKDLNRMLLSEMRRVEKKTRLRAEWTSANKVEKFFDYVQKSSKNVADK